MKTNKIIKKSTLIFFITLLYMQVPSSFGIKNLYDMNNNFYSQREAIECGWPGISVIDLREGPQNTIFAGTGGGLGYITPEYNTDNIYYSVNDSNLPIGGNPGLKTIEINGEWMVVVSGVESCTYFGQEFSCGAGLSWTLDNQTWYHMDQPQDSSGSSYGTFDWYGQTIAHRRVTTNAQNVSYDVSIDTSQGYIYAASWAGMLRRFNYLETSPEWEIVPLPMDNQDSLICGEIENNYYYDPVDPPFGNHNHKGFSVHIENDIIWAGTANGINKGIIRQDGCINWYHYTTDDGLAGDWIIGFDSQDLGQENQRIWALSWVTDGGPAPHGLTYTEDNGDSWVQVNQFIDEGAIVYGIYFHNDKIYVSTDIGLYVSQIYDTQNWTKIDIPLSIIEQLQTEKIYSIIVNDNLQKMWVGTPQGIITTDINIFNEWEIPSLDLIDCPDNENEKLIIYPNPYYTDNAKDIQFKIKTDYENGIIDIFDFSMSKVSNSISCNKEGPFLKATWDGTNNYNSQVVNGTYFCRLKVLDKEFWNKLIVVNIK